MPLRPFKLPFIHRRRSSMPGSDFSADVSIPYHFRCPISLDLMKDPVTLITGITFDRSSIETWIEAGNLTCPVTKQPITLLPASGNNDAVITPNHAIRRMIQDWCVSHRSHGIERIPTPKIPVTSMEVARTLLEISASVRRGDGACCAQSVAKLKSWAAESERNRRCITSNGAARVLAAAYRDLPSEQLLSSIVELLPLDKEARRELASPESLNSVVTTMKNGNLSARFHSIMVVKEIAAANNEESAMITRTEGMIEAITRLIKEPISPQATKTALVAAYHIAAAFETAASRFAELGIVSALLDMLVDADKSFCEKGLALLDAVLSTEKGREVAAGNDLALPVIVKRMLRVSSVATEFAVSGLWKLCFKKHGNGGKEGELWCLRQAMEGGAFQKLLLMLQVGCSESTKEKVTELLKAMNYLRGTTECIESLDFKGLYRPF